MHCLLQWYITRTQLLGIEVDLIYCCLHNYNVITRRAVFRNSGNCDGEGESASCDPAFLGYSSVLYVIIMSKLWVDLWFILFVWYVCNAVPKHLKWRIAWQWTWRVSRQATTWLSLLVAGLGRDVSMRWSWSKGGLHHPPVLEYRVMNKIPSYVSLVTTKHCFISGAIASFYDACFLVP